MTIPRPHPLLGSLLLVACSGRPCEPPARTGELPPELRESSGADFSVRHPGVLWTHNDSGSDPVLFAIDSTGRVLARVEVQDAANRDWEDVAVGACGAHGGACIWIADTGDNDSRRETVTLYRIPEPTLDDARSDPADAFPLRFPDGPRDAEALAIDPGGVPHIVSKGRAEGVALYRYPGPLRPGKAVELELVHVFADTAVALADQVTGADWSEDGRWLATRTYSALHLWRMEDGRGPEPLVPGGVPLDSLREYQGEAVALRDDGLVALTSEAAEGEAASLGVIRCRLR